MKCLVCNHRLNEHVEVKNGEVVDRNWIHAYVHDHPPVPVEEGNYRVTSVCDFCGRERDIHTVLLCAPYGALVIENGEMTQHMDDGQWAACDDCVPYLVPSFSRATLLERARESHKAMYCRPDADVQISPEEMDMHIDTSVALLYKHIERTYIGCYPINPEEV